MLIEKGATININSGLPLFNACENNSYEIVKLLIEKGASIDINNGQSLCESCKYGRYEIVKLLIEKGATIDINNGSALSYACRMNHYKIVILMLSYLPKIMKPCVSYKSDDMKIREIFNNYNSLIYQLDGTIRYLPEIVSFNFALFIGII